MDVVCLDLEGVLIPEIWIAFAEAVGIPEFRRTTRDEPDYDALMRFRLELLARHKLRLPDIQRVAGTIEPLPGAAEFCAKLRRLTQVVILSDTFEQFAAPIMAKLAYPTLFCNSLVTSADGAVTGYRLRQPNGKKHAVTAFKSMNLNVFAAGDSFNDLAMINEADSGCLFRAPEQIRRDYPQVSHVDSFDELLERIGNFLQLAPGSAIG